VVDGKLSLFLDGSEGGERESALAVIRDHMSRNIYVNVHPDIVRVTYVDFVALRAGPAVQPSPQADGGKKGLAIYTYVLIAAGVLFLSVLALVLVRKRRKIPTHVDEEKSLANDYESPPAFPAIHG
jgi:LPXTG-motif cell wall-anchored protein